MRRKYCPHHGNFGVWGIFGIDHTLLYVFHSNFPEADLQIATEKCFIILT